jgi:N-methylhydantoinase A
MSTRIGVDIGGTFTDLVVYDDQSGLITVEKVPTTPEAPEQGCISAVRKAAAKGALEECEYFLHGTTVGLNALLERRGATVGLLCTEGFRDSLEIRRGSRPEAYDLSWVPPDPLVPRHLRLPVKERIDAEGNVRLAVDPKSVDSAVAVFRAHGVTSIAVCLMNAYANPEHELRVAELLCELGFSGDISLSHNLSREYRDYERTSTTVIDAFVRNRMANYLDNVAHGIAAIGFSGNCLITRSGGGCMSFTEARERSFETVNSGPVAGAEGAAELSRALRLGDLVTADVGGTSFDTSLILDGRPHLLYQGEIANMPIQAPWVDVRSIGAGGGSLAYVDEGGLLHVGPRSAGAKPGPACYGRGGDVATVTDAALYLGMLGSGRIASDVILDRGKAETAIQAIAAKLNRTITETSTGIIQIACSSMANAIREITVEQGVDPRGLKLLAFGGAGPLLATQMARELDINHIVVPPFAGNFSAWGLVGSDLIRSSSRTQRFALTSDGLRDMRTTVSAMFDHLESRAEEARLREGERRELSVALRFAGQEHSLNISVPLTNGAMTWEPDDFVDAFRNSYQKTFGITLDKPVEAIVLRAAVRKPLPRKYAHAYRKQSNALAPAPVQVYSFAQGRVVPAHALFRDSLEPGIRYPGPAIIYEDTTTTYVDADFSYGSDANACLLINREAKT